MEYRLISSHSNNPFNDGSFIKKQIFKNRNIEMSKSFLSPTKENLEDYQNLDNIQQGVSLLLKHLNKGQIFLVVDSDVDGYTSSAIFYNYLHKINPSLDVRWMVHQEKKHGVVIEEIPSTTTLVVLIDSGSNQYEEHKILKEKGIDVLVIDHHEAIEYSKDAIVINNKLSERYSNKFLSGAGLAYKFCQALDDYFQVSYADYFLDLTALGIIADVMDVTELENRYIISEGLKNINNPFFKSLILKQQYSLGNKPLNTIGIMFYIAPLINSLIRVGSLEEKELMFQAFIEGDSLIESKKRGAKGQMIKIAEEAARICSNARARQKKMTDELQQEIEEVIQEKDLLSNPVLIVLLKEINNKNLTGLVANQLAHKYHKPTLILIEDEEELSYSGSGRNYNSSNIENLKDFLNETELFDFAEGHQSAFGAKIQEENIDSFLEYCNKNLEIQEDLTQTYLVDFIFNSKEFSLSSAKEIATLRPLWGKNFDEPYIVIKDIKIFPKDIQYMGKEKNHIKFHYNGVDFIIFGIDREEMKSYEHLLTVDVIGRCDINIWRDRLSYQVMVKEYQIRESPISFGF